MRAPLVLLLSAYALVQAQTVSPKVAAIADYTSYQAGGLVQVRLQPATQATVSIRYRGEDSLIVTDVPISGSEYAPVWKIPGDARTGRYDLDLATSSGKVIRTATSFAVHRQSAKIISVELDKTFYTSGDAVNPTIKIQNVSNKRLEHVQVEFEPYTYPWIAPEPDEPPMWKYIVDSSLSLDPGEEKIFHAQKAAVVHVDKEPEGVYYSVVVRDSRNPDHIYDLAFVPPAITIPINTPLPKQYPFLYSYLHLRDVVKSEAYRTFYPPEFISSVIHFETSHTIFPTGVAPAVDFSVTTDAPQKGSYLHTQVLDDSGHELESHKLSEHVAGTHTATLQPRTPGRYLLQVALETENGTTIARNQIELAVDQLPKSILIFCAHDDDDTAHPGIIRAAVENHIPIHFVYLTGSDGGGCDRFFMHSCDAARAMDFGEVRMEESRASLAHLGVARDDIFFLGLPDGGLGQVWEATNPDHPYLSVLLASEHSPYVGSAISNLTYAREPVIKALKQFIGRFHPDLIITGHPDERHVDHRVNNWLVVKAMRDMVKDRSLSPETELIVDQVYGQQPGRHAPYRFEKFTFFVSGEAAKLGQEATWYYQSQEGNHQQANLTEFTKLPREEPYRHFKILDWQSHEGWNETLKPTQGQ